MESDNEKQSDDDTTHPTISTDHPLLNSAIMENVFKHMDSSITTQDLKSVRAVCSLWNNLTFTKWRSMATLRLGPPTAGNSLLHNYLPVNEFITIGNDPESSYQFGTVPFTKYALHSINFVEVPVFLKASANRRRYSSRNLWAFFDSLGIQLDTFKFEVCTFPGDRLKVFEEIFTQKLANVKKLTLTNNKIIPVKCPKQEKSQLTLVTSPGYTPRNSNLKTLDVEGPIPMEACAMLLNCPNLENLKLQNIPGSDNLNYMILRPLNFHRRQILQGPSKIRKFEAMNSSFFSKVWIPARGFQNLLGLLEMRLETVSLNLEPNESKHFKDDNDIEIVLTSFIREYRKSLKVLKVFRPPVYKAPRPTVQPFMGVEMRALTELHLLGNVVICFSFLRSTPNLKILNVNFSCVDKADQFKRLFLQGKDLDEELEKFQERYLPFNRDLVELTPVITQQLIHLKQMCSLRLDWPLFRKSINILAGWMPNLKILQGNFKSEEMRAVFKWMPNLEELVVLSGSDFDEKVLTGDMGHGRRHPNNITALKRLRRFQMDGSCGGKCVVSEHSVDAAFLKIGSLESLRICVSITFSQESEDILRNHVGNLTILREKLRHDGIERDCCREAAFLGEFFGLED